MHVHLDERAIANALEAVNLSCLDDEDISGASFKGLPIYGPQSAPFPDELDLVVGMTVRPRPPARLGVEQEHGDIYVALVGADELMRAAHEWQILLTDMVHPYPPG
jgi:hypothetical protein